MRGIVINSRNRTVVEIDLVPTLDRLQQIVGGLIEPVEQGLDDEHQCYVNEEGLLDNPQHFFMFTGGHQPLAGNGIILASTGDGVPLAARMGQRAPDLYGFLRPPALVPGSRSGRVDA
jgi:hypothetical protein